MGSLYHVVLSEQIEFPTCAVRIQVTVHRFQVSGFRETAVTIKKCMDVECLEVYSKLCLLRKERFRILD